MTNKLDDQLLAAQNKARRLVKEIEERKLLAIGATEKEVSDRIFELAFEVFGTKRHWHKRVVRTGANTFHSYKADPPNLAIKAGDLVYLDLGPVFDDFEGDFGKTYLFGNDPDKVKLLADLDLVFSEGKKFYLSQPSMTGATLWSKINELTEQTGWGFGNTHAGHIVGEFSHSQKYGDAPEHRINPLNHLAMDAPGADGQKRHWILEIHLVDKNGKFGGFFEDLLTLPT